MEGPAAGDPSISSWGRNGVEGEYIVSGDEVYVGTGVRIPPRFDDYFSEGI